MKKYTPILLSVLLASSLAACGGSNKPTEAATEAPAETKAPAETETEEPVGIANPWTECADLAEAEAIAGFTFSFRDVIGCGAYYAKEFSAMEGMLDVTYYAEGSTEPEDSYVIRQAALTTEDISGDYNEYSHDFIDGDAGVDEVRLRGTKDFLSVATFNYGDYSYAIYPGSMDYIETFSVIGEMTGVDPTVYTYDIIDDETEAEAIEEEEPAEGAPVVEEGRLIADEAIDVTEIAGKYSGINYGDLTLNVYTSPEGNVIGCFELQDANGEIAYTGELCEHMTNLYGQTDTDLTISVYSDNGNYGLDVYSCGEHLDYFVMSEHHETCTPGHEHEEHKEH